MLQHRACDRLMPHAVGLQQPCLAAAASSRRPHGDPGAALRFIKLTTCHKSFCFHAARSDPGLSRRHLLLSPGLLLGIPGLLAAPAQAGLLQFPANELHNTYYLVRAGESEMESRGTVMTNPVWKTGMVLGLSERGKAQVVRQTVPTLRALGVGSDSSPWIWPSITQNSYQTAEVLAALLGIGRSKIVPEYSFLDMRGIGAWDGQDVVRAYNQCHEFDRYDADWRPPAGYDGTPNESVNDVLTRMRQLLSITETQYSGEDVVVVAPDSELLSVLQAAVLGADLRQHAAYGFQPGEVRVLQLAERSFDDTPRRLACPHPPTCK